MATVQCLSCDAMNDAIATGGYCDTCGKKLPNYSHVRAKRSMTAGPTGDDTGPRDPALKARFAASEGLFAAAVVHLVAGAAFLMFGPFVVAGKVPENFFPTVVSWALLPAMLVGLLGGVARWMPRPALVGSALAVVAFACATFALEPTLAPAWLAVEAITLAVVGYAFSAGRGAK